MTEYVGQQFKTTTTSEESAHAFRIERMLNRVSTATLVKVKSVTTKGDLAAVGFVDVNPLVKLQDGLGRQYDHATAFNLPYFRLQGGKNAVIMDPIAGDIGVAVFADRDISGVKNNKQAGPAGSRRRFSMADGLFFPCFLGDTPENYIQFKSSGTIIAKTKNGSTMCVSNTQNYAAIKFKTTQWVIVTDQGIIVSQDPVVGVDPNPNND